MIQLLNYNVFNDLYYDSLSIYFYSLVLTSSL
jgi:hypothetical protein